MTGKRTVQLVFTGLLTALVCVATMVIKIPTPTNGYVNLGDAVVLISGWLLGPWYGFFAAGVGSAMTDLLSGYVAYVPGTLLIKGSMAVVAYVVSAHGRGGVYLRGLSAFLAEVCMIVGYFIYESTVLGYGMGAVAGITGNIAQGIAGLTLSMGCYQMMQVTGLNHQFERLR